MRITEILTLDLQKKNFVLIQAKYWSFSLSTQDVPCGTMEVISMVELPAIKALT